MNLLFFLLFLLSITHFLSDGCFLRSFLSDAEDVRSPLCQVLEGAVDGSAGRVDGVLCRAGSYLLVALLHPPIIYLSQS